MMYLMNIELKKNKRLNLIFKQIFGIGKSLSIELLKILGLNSSYKILSLNSEQKEFISLYLKNNFILEEELKRHIIENINKNITTKSYKGWRHIYGLPVRGQRTHTNARTKSRVILKLK